jgi:hypothetical protein
MGNAIAKAFHSAIDESAVLCRIEFQMIANRFEESTLDFPMEKLNSSETFPELVSVNFQQSVIGQRLRPASHEFP